MDEEQDTIAQAYNYLRPPRQRPHGVDIVAISAEDNRIQDDSEDQSNERCDAQAEAWVLTNASVSWLRLHVAIGWFEGDGII